jgi:hypothetical protein
LKSGQRDDHEECASPRRSDVQTNEHLLSFLSIRGQPGRAITKQLDRLYPGAPATPAVPQNSVCEWMAESILAQEENSPMVARPKQPIYPACVPPSKSHPPTSCELFVPVSGASPKTSGPASGTVSKGSLVQDQTSYLRKYQSAASTSSLPRYGTRQGWCRRRPKLSNQEEGLRQSCGRDRSPSDRMKRDPTCDPYDPRLSATTLPLLRPVAPAASPTAQRFAS